MRLLKLTWVLPILLACISACLAKLEVAYEWKYIDYLWDNNDKKQDAITCGIYDYTKIFPTDFQQLPNGQGMIATPRLHNNPASLSIISNETGDGGPLLEPFPNWSWHTKEDCSGITSVGTVFLDEDNTLWFVDSGKIENEQVCPAKLLQFDVQTKELLLQVDIPLNLTHSPNNESRGRLDIQVIERADGQIWVYISDKEGYGLVIWDGIDIWRLDGEVFCPTVDGEKFSIAGENFTLGVGPQGLLITPPGFLKQTYLLMKPMSSLKAYMIPTGQLHESKSGSKVDYYLSNIDVSTQEPGKAFTKSNGVLIASLITQNALACYNLQNPVTEDYIAVVETNSTTLQFVNTIKITTEEKDKVERLWALSNRLQKIVLGTMDFKEINFRVLQASVNELIAGTVCEPKEHDIADSITEKNFDYYTTL